MTKPNTYRAAKKHKNWSNQFKRLSERVCRAAWDASLIFVSYDAEGPLFEFVPPSPHDSEFAHLLGIRIGSGGSQVKLYENLGDAD